MLIWMFIAVFADIFRRNDLSGGWKAIWILAIFILPRGILIYLVSRPKVTAQDVQQMTQMEAGVKAAAALLASPPPTSWPSSSSSRPPVRSPSRSTRRSRPSSWPDPAFAQSGPARSPSGAWPASTDSRARSRARFRTPNRPRRPTRVGPTGSTAGRSRGRGRSPRGSATSPPRVAERTVMGRLAVCVRRGFVSIGHVGHEPGRIVDRLEDVEAQVARLPDWIARGSPGRPRGSRPRARA